MTKRVGYTKSPHTHLLSHATLKTRMCVCVCNDRRWVTIELEMLLKSFNWYATTQQRLNRQYFFSFFFFLFCSTVKLSPEGILNRPHRELLPPPTSYNSYYKMGFPMENAPAVLLETCSQRSWTATWIDVLRSSYWIIEGKAIICHVALDWILRMYNGTPTPNPEWTK
jgi:hypothetical protein